MSRLPLGAGFACFVTDCYKPMKMLFIAFDTGFPLPAYNCQPLRGFPPGGKLLAKRGDEGQSINRQLVFNPEKRHFPNRSPCFPLRGKWRAYASR